jgi:hypothetical protein
MRENLIEARRNPKMRKNKVYFRFFGSAITFVMLAVFIYSCSKEVVKDPAATNTVQTQPVIAATSPANQADTVAINPVVAATFNSSASPADVSASTITLKEGTATVAGTLTADGSTVNFTPGADLKANTTYTATITITKKGSSNDETSEHTWTFTTGKNRDDHSFSVVSVSPLNSATAVTTRTKSLKISLMQGTTPVLGSITFSGRTATFTPASKLIANTVYTAKVVNGSYSGGEGDDDHKSGSTIMKTWSFTTAGGGIDVTAPTVLSAVPANNTTGVAINSHPTVTFSEAMTASTVSSATFTLNQGTTAVAGTIAYSGNTATFTPSASLVANTIYTGTITTGVKDAAGNALASNYTWSFTTASAADVTPPTVLSAVPANSATGVSISTHPVVTFSESMTASTVTSATFILNQGTTAVAGTVAYSGTTATFTPSASLAANTLYTGTITTGAKDAAGNALASNYTWSFTTAAAADVTPPTVMSMMPANGAMSVAVSSNVSATFSEAMTASTINSTTLTVKQGTTAIAGTVSYSGTTATFTPSSAFAGSTVYTATMTTGAKDAAGNSLASNSTWSFTTATPADVTPPTVMSMMPANGAMSVAVSSNVSATFSEAMTASTINSATFTVKQGTTAVVGTVSYSGTTATFTPSSAFAGSTVYTATMTTGAKDAAGNSLASNSTWSFTTATPADVTPPTVMSMMPASGATSIAVSSNVTATFSEAMTASTINSTTFTVKQGTTAVAGTVSYSGTTATFTPSSAFAGSTVYTATITTGAKDAAGNAITAAQTWNFTTIATVTLVSFATDVLPIVQSKCMPCHGASGPSAGISLTNYTQIKAIGSNLDNPSMYSKMSVSAAQQTTIQAWLAQGSLNN